MKTVSKLDAVVFSKLLDTLYNGSFCGCKCYDIGCIEFIDVAVDDYNTCGYVSHYTIRNDSNIVGLVMMNYETLNLKCCTYDLMNEQFTKYDITPCEMVDTLTR